VGFAPFFPQSIAIGSAAGGGLTGTYPNPTVAPPLDLTEAAAGGQILVVTDTTGAPTDAIALIESTNVGDRGLGLRITTDTFSRLLAGTDGALKWSSGTAGADVVLGRSAAGILSLTTGSLDVSTAGSGLRVAESANGKQGTFTLTGGTTQVVPNTSVTANSRIFLTAQVVGGTPGIIGVSSRSPGTSFTVFCVATDTSTYAFEIFEPG
jgi:hypothetical protein